MGGDSMDNNKLIAEFMDNDIQPYDKDKNLLPCPICGGTEFVTADMDILNNIESTNAHILCCNCPYYLRDEGVSLAELISMHNNRV